jgi:D-galactonate transporter
MNQNIAAESIRPLPAVADAKRLHGVYAKVSRRILPLMLLGYIIAYLDRVNVGFAKLQMSADLGFSETVYGLGAGVFFLGYFLFEVPSNMILHRVGARVWLARIMITWGMTSAAMMLVTSPTMFYTLRFLLGAAEAGFFPGVIFYLTQWYPAERRGKANALFMTGVAISSVVGSLLSGWIMQTFDGMNDWAGWQWLFLLEALPAVLVGIYILWRLTDDIAGAVWLDAGEKAMLADELAREAVKTPAGTFMDAFRDGRVWFACLIYFCIVAGLYGTGFWLPTIISEMGIESPLEVGMLVAIPYAAAAIGMVLIGRSADRRGERRWHLAIPATAGALGLVLSVVYSDSTLVAMVALTLATCGILTTLPLFWSFPTAYLSGAAAAVGIAIINSFGNLAGFAAPYAVGWIKDFTGSTAIGMYVLAAFVFTGGVLVLAGIPARLVNR